MAYFNIVYWINNLVKLNQTTPTNLAEQSVPF